MSQTKQQEATNAMRSEFVKLRNSQSKEESMSFVIGNFGWDNLAEVVEARVYEVLEAVGVTKEMVRSLACRGMKGSL
eukprot:8136609-Karenia_brevis.AAC.1